MNPSHEQLIAMDAAEKARIEERARVERLFNFHLGWHTVNMTAAELVQARVQFIGAVRGGEDTR